MKPSNMISKDPDWLLTSFPINEFFHPRVFIPNDVVNPDLIELLQQLLEKNPDTRIKMCDLRVRS